MVAAPAWRKWFAATILLLFGATWTAAHSRGSEESLAEDERLRSLNLPIALENDLPIESIHPFDFWNIEGSGWPIRTSWTADEDILWMVHRHSLITSSADEPGQSVDRSGEFTSLLQSYAVSDLLLDRSVINSTPQQAYLHNPWRTIVNQEAKTDWGQIKSKVEFPDPLEVSSLPYINRDWKTNQSVNVPLPMRVPLANSIFLFGQVSSGSADALVNPQMSLNTKTGLGMKFVPLDGTELQFRGGTMLNYTDLMGPTGQQGRTQVLVEMQAKLQVFGPLNLQYIGQALPAMQSTDPNKLNQDLRFAIPLGPNQEFQIGAKYRWESTMPSSSTSPWYDRAELYLGLQFNR